MLVMFWGLSMVTEQPLAARNACARQEGCSLQDFCKRYIYRCLHHSPWRIKPKGLRCSHNEQRMDGMVILLHEALELKIGGREKKAYV